MLGPAGGDLVVKRHRPFLTEPTSTGCSVSLLPCGGMHTYQASRSLGIPTLGLLCMISRRGTDAPLDPPIIRMGVTLGQL